MPLTQNTRGATLEFSKEEPEPASQVESHTGTVTVACVDTPRQQPPVQDVFDSDAFVDSDVIDLKLLVVAANREESNLAAIVALLDRLGTPYDTFIASEERLTEGHLWHGRHAYYQGIILTTGNLGYKSAVTQSWESAFNSEQWQTLWRYEACFGIRQVTWYTMPGGYPDDYGLRLQSVRDTQAHPLHIRLTEAGKDVFSYLNSQRLLTISSAWAYLAEAADEATTPLLVGPLGEIVAAIRHYHDDRENLAVTIDNSPSLKHSLLLGYGLINWVTRGLFLGSRRVYLSCQVDDIFFRTKLWSGEPKIDHTNDTYRLSRADIQALLTWQQYLHARTRNAANIQLEFAFNGEGAVFPPPNDTLVPCMLNNQSQFRWVNHTFKHPKMDDLNYDTCFSEISLNHKVACGLELQHYHHDSLVTPEISGLNNADFIRAARDTGIRFLVSDTSRMNGEHPGPNQGVVSTLAPEILIVPRHPNNLFFNVSTPGEWVSEYNHIYFDFWKRNLSFEEIVDREAETVLQYLLTFDMAPLMFHQANLRAYDGNHCLLSVLIERVITKYNDVYGNVPVCSMSLHTIGEAMTERSIYQATNIQAALFVGKGLRLVADRDVVVPLTGVPAGTETEHYGGQVLSAVALTADTPYWIPVPALNTPQARAEYSNNLIPGNA